MSNILTLLSKPVHATFYPYAWFTTLHAFRVSLAFHQLSQSRPLAWKTHVGGFLVMSWGGMFLTHNLLNINSPIAYNIHPWINYISVHLIITFLVSIYPAMLTAPLLNNTALFPLDGVLRANAVMGALSIPNQNPKLSNSLLFNLLLGALAPSGGGILAGTFQTYTPNWSFTTPVFLREEIPFWALLDLWGGAVVAGAFGILSGHPAFVGIVDAKKLGGGVDPRTAAVSLFVGLFAAKVWIFSPRPTPTTKEQKEKKEK